MTFRNITEKDGLSSNNTYAIAEDKRGFIWIGGTNGLDKYDGSKFTHFKKGNPYVNMLENAVIDLYIDSSNTIHLSHFNSHCSTNLDHPSIQFSIEGIQAPFTTFNNNKCLVHDNSEVYELQNFKDKKTNKFLIRSKKLSANIGKTYRLIYEYKGRYIGIREDSIFFLNEKFTVQKTVKSPKSAVIQELILDDYYAYVVSFNAPIYKLDLKSYQLIKIGDEKNINKIVYNGSKWRYNDIDYYVFASCNHGIVLYDEKRNLYYDYPFGIDQCISNVFVDSRNNLWLTSDKNGIYLVSNFQSTIKPIKIPKLSNEISYVYNIHEIGEEKLVCTRYNSGTYLYDKNWNFKSFIGFSTQNLKSEFKGQVFDIYDVIEKEGKLHVSIDRGLVKLDLGKKSKNNLNPYLEIPKARNIIPISDSIWLIRTVENGVIKYNHYKNSILKKHYIKNQNGDNIILKFLTKSKKSILLCSEKGLYEYDLIKDTFYLFDIPALNFKTISRVIDGSNDDLWITSLSGIYNLKYGTDNKSHNLVEISNSDCEYIINNKRQIWYSTNSGINFYDPKSKVTKTFDKSLGLWDKFGACSVFKLKNNDIMACAEDVLYKIDEEKFLSFKENNHIFFESIKENKTEYIDKMEKGLLTLEPGIRNPIITFSSPSYLAPNNILYSYKSNNDANWTILDQNQILLSGLTYGKHTISVRGINKITGESTSEETLNIYVKPYWYQTIWFKILMLLALLASFYYLYRLRIRNITKKMNERKMYEQRIISIEMDNLRNQMNPHFLFNALNSINRYIVQNETKLASDYLSKFSRLMRQILENSKKEFISLAREIETLELYLLIEANRFDNSFTYTIKNLDKIDADQILVPPLFIQPFVENAIWHGLHPKPEDKKLEISFELINDNTVLVVTINDNGIGREMSRKLESKSSIKVKSYGIDTTLRRLKIINEKNEIKIDDIFINDKVCGTSVKIYFHMIDKIDA